MKSRNILIAFLLIYLIPIILHGAKIDPSLLILSGYYKDYNGNLYPVDVNIRNSKIGVFSDIVNNNIKIKNDTVFVWTKGSSSYIASLDYFYRQYYDWFILKVPIDSISKLKNDTLIDIVLPVRKFVPALDSALVATGAKPLLNIGDNGKNVIVGIIDECVDPYIDGLCLEDSTRFLYIKDLVNDTVYSDNIPQLKDTIGHATSLLGIVGLEKNNLTGFAPKSSFIASIGSLWADDVIEGVLWMDSLVKEENKPFVLLLPLQHYWHVPFALSPEEEILDSVFSWDDTGKVCIAPAGNIGNRRKVAVSKVFTNDTSLLNWESNYSIYYSTGSFYNGVFSVFIPTSSLPVFRLLFNNDGNYYMTDWIGADSIPMRIVTNNNDTLFISYSKYWTCDEYGNDYDYLFIWVKSLQKDYFIGIQIYGENSGDYIALVPSNGYCRTGLSEELPSYRGYEICVPGNAHHVVTVGAVTNRLSWIDNYGILRHIDGNVGQIASWSSCGYSGQGKPDISAPGRFVKTLWPSYVNINEAYQSEGYAIVSGTSVSSAVVAGICSMILSVKPNIPAKTLYSIITDRPYWDFYMDENLYGRGIINIYVSLVNYLVDLMSVNVVNVEYVDNIVKIKWHVINGNAVDRWILEDDQEIKSCFPNNTDIYEWEGEIDGKLKLLGINPNGRIVYKKILFSSIKEEKLKIFSMVDKIRIIAYFDGSISIYNAIGRKEKSISVKNGDEYDIKLKSGLYFVKTNDGNIRKIIVK